MSVWSRAKKSVSEKLARNWAPEAQPSRAAAPLASFTFDDFPVSARTNGARILKSRGVRGSYYAAGSFEGRHEDGLDYFRRDDLSTLVEDGHEIGCHTFGHIRLPFASDAEISGDLERNRQFVDEALGGYEMVSFAYPFGHVNVARKAMIGRRFKVCRGIFPGVNRGRIDLRQLKAIPLERRSFDHDVAERALDAGASSNGWVTFFSHDVSDHPSPYGCTPDDLARLIDAALVRGFTILPVKEAAALVAGTSAAPSGEARMLPA